MLEYRVDGTGREAELRLRGSLADEEWTERLLTFLDENFLRGDGSVVRVNLAEVQYVDLEGVATLVRLASAARDRGKRLVVSGADGNVREKLVRTGVMDFLSDVEPDGG
jgi:anti-anti-sigma factor